MSGTALVAWHEFRLNVFKKSFILVLLSVPLLLLLQFVFVRLMIASERSDLPLGYVDHSGLLADPLILVLEDESERVPLVAFPDESQARFALDQRQVQAYYVLAASYPLSGQVDLVYRKQPGENAVRQFTDFLQLNLMASFPEQVARRTAQGSQMVVRSLQDGRVYPDGDPTLSMVLPLIIGVAFIGLFLTGSGYLMQAAYTERENRTIEILMTTISPRQIVTGKVLGVVAINAMQLVFWAFITGLALGIGRNVLAVPWMVSLQLDLSQVLKLVLIAVPSYVVVSALMFAAGWMVGKPQDSERLGPLVFMAHLLPLYLFPLMGSNPENPLAVLLNILPLTAVFTFGIRSLLMVVPWWQVILSSFIQIVSAVLALKFAALAFQQGWSSYGTNLSLRQVLNGTTGREAKA